MTPALTSTATLSQLRLSNRHRDTARDLADVHRMHQRVMSLFPDTFGDDARATAAVLHRVEHTPTGAIVLVQSTHEPDTTRLPDNYATVTTRNLGALLSHLEAGMVVRYRIVANPTAIRTTDGKKQRRWLHGDDATDWWHRKAHHAGLNPDTVLLAHEDLLTGNRSDPQGTRRICHGATQFDGTATITDPNATREAVLTGIGRGRSHGCGLLTLAPTRMP